MTFSHLLRKLIPFLCTGALLMGALSAGHAQAPAASGVLDLDLRARIAAVGSSGAKLHAATLRLGIVLAPASASAPTARTDTARSPRRKRWSRRSGEGTRAAPRLA